MKGHDVRKHALLSASGAARWLNCTPSPRLEEEFKAVEETSVYAAEGTLAHEFADLGLQLAIKKITKAKYNKLITEQIEKYISDYEVKDFDKKEMFDQVQKYIDYCMEQFVEAKKRTKDALMLIEEKIDLTHYIEGGFGTNDNVIIADGVMEVTDLKYGKGIKVDAEENPQLKLYGLGALREHELSFDIHTIKLTIVQPRLDHISTWAISASDLKEWAESEVRPKAKLAYAGKGELCAGAWCRWCGVKPKCRALAEKNLELVKYEFKQPDLLEDDELLEVYEKLEQLTDWANSVSTYILSEALNGKSFEGYKVVEGRSVRRWQHEESVKLILAERFKPEQYLNSRLKSLTDISKLLGKEVFESDLKDFVIKPAGKPTLVPESDKRPAMGNDSAKEDFKK